MPKKIQVVTKEKLLSMCEIKDGPLNTPCWEWTGTQRGPNRATIGRRYGSHVAYELFNGPIPNGMWILHKCDNGMCVNPEHLYAGTPKQNCRDRLERGRDAVALFNSDQVQQMRVRYANGESIATIARTYSIDAGAMSRLVRGLTYRHVPMIEPQETNHHSR